MAAKLRNRCVWRDAQVVYTFILKFERLFLPEQFIWHLRGLWGDASWRVRKYKNNRIMKDYSLINVQKIFLEKFTERKQRYCRLI